MAVSQAELVTAVLQRRASGLGVAPPSFRAVGVADVLFRVATLSSPSAAAAGASDILAHSAVLASRSHHFRELLGAQADDAAPSEEEEDDDGEDLSQELLSSSPRCHVSGIVGVRLRVQEEPLGSGHHDALVTCTLTATEPDVPCEISPPQSQTLAGSKRVRFSTIAFSMDHAGRSQVVDLSWPRNAGNTKGKTGVKEFLFPQTEAVSTAARPKLLHKEMVLLRGLMGGGSSSGGSKPIVVSNLRWTLSMLTAILEWLYTEICHIDIEDLAAVYMAADRIALTSLTVQIRQYPMREYLRMAFRNSRHRKALLELCNVADCLELKGLQSFCKSLDFSDAAMVGSVPRSSIRLDLANSTAKSLAEELIHAGFLELDNHHPVYIGWSEEADARAPHSPFITFNKGKPYQPCKNRSSSTSKGATSWCITVLNQDIPGSCHSFLNRISANLEKKRERFKLRMITRFQIGTILKKAFERAIPAGLTVKEKRGGGYFIKAPSYCTSITLSGPPLELLLAIKAIPYDMMGRSCLKVAGPSTKTFSALFMTTLTLGVDFRSGAIYLVKPLYSIMKMLEFLTKLNDDALEPLHIERTLLELVQPVDPF